MLVLNDPRARQGSSRRRRLRRRRRRRRRLRRRPSAGSAPSCRRWHQRGRPNAAPQVRARTRTLAPHPKRASTPTPVTALLPQGVQSLRGCAGRGRARIAYGATHPSTACPRRPPYAMDRTLPLSACTGAGFVIVITHSIRLNSTLGRELGLSGNLSIRLRVHLHLQLLHLHFHFHLHLHLPTYSSSSPAPSPSSSMKELCVESFRLPATATGVTRGWVPPTSKLNDTSK